MWDDHDLRMLARDRRAGARAGRAGRDRAVAHGRARREQRVAAAGGGAVADRRRLRGRGRAAGDDQARHPPRAGRLGGGGAALARRRLRHRLRVRRAHVPARPVPVAPLQPAHRRVRRIAREPGPVLAGDAGAGARGGRRRLRGGLPGGGRPPRRAGRRPRRGPRVRVAGRPPGRPLGRDGRLDRRVVAGLRAVPLLPPRAGSWRAPAACARRRASRSWAWAG